MEENPSRKFSVACPGCAARFQVKLALAGKQVQCPKCSGPFQVPEADPRPEAASQAPPPSGRRGGRSGERPTLEKSGRRPRSSPGEKGANKGLLFAGVGVLVVLVVVGIVVLGQGGQSGPPSEFVQARESASGLPPAQGALKWIEIAERAAEAEWEGAQAESAHALQMADAAARELPRDRAALAVHLDGARRLAGGRWAERASHWLDRAAAAARGIENPLTRMEELLSLADRLESEEALARGRGLVPGLFRDALAAAGTVPEHGRVRALLDLEGRLPKQEGPFAQLRQQVFQQVVRIDSDHARARAALGHIRVPADSPIEDRRGQWLETDTQIRIYNNQLAQIEKQAEAERQEAERWRRDRFARACARLRSEMEREIPGIEWNWFFDDEIVKRPYLMAVEESQIPSTIGIAREQGQVLNSMVTNFYKYYEGLLTLEAPNRPLGVFIFSSKSSYAEFQKKHQGNFPDPRGIGGFFNGVTTRMYLWAKDDMRGGGTPMDLTAIMFHEGTHQLMHYHKKTPGPQIGNSPWLQEGIAEYFGGYYTRFIPGTDPPVREFRNGKFMEGRYEAIFTPALRSVETGEVQQGILPLKQLMYLDYTQFREIQWGQRRNPRLVSIVYAQGWAFVHFCKNFVKNGQRGYYRDRFEQYLKGEIEGITDGDHFARVFGLRSDRDWETLQSEFYRYLIDSSTGMRHYMYESRGRSPGYWPDEKEQL